MKTEWRVESEELSGYNEYSEYAEYNRIMENPDYALDSKTETKKQRHIIIIFGILLVCVVLAIFIVNLWNIAEVSLAKSYVKENYGDKYSYVSSKAVYMGGGCVVFPKESVTVVFQGDDLSVMTVIVKDGKVMENA